MSNVTIDHNIYGYTPNEPLSVVGATYFGLMGFLLLLLTCRSKTWIYGVIIFGCAMECWGFALRPYSETSVGLYVLAVLGVLLAPTIFAMADYSFISKILDQTKIYPGGLSPTFIRRVFMAADFGSFVVQCAGGGLTAMNNDNSRKIGADMLLGGLCLALSVFIFFLFVTYYVHTRLRQTGHDVVSSNHWRRFQFLFVDMLLLILRSCYRVAEYANQQYHNSISTNETLFYVLDALPMSVLVGIWFYFHPFFEGYFTKSSSASPESPESTNLGPLSGPNAAEYGGTARKGSDEQV